MSNFIFKFSFNYFDKLADNINTCGIQFNDFRISLTAPNLIALREVIVFILNYLEKF